MSLTVACLFIRGEYPYTVEYVQRLREGVARHLSRPFRFVCLTDRPHEMPAGVEAIAVERIPSCYAFWTRLRMFDASLGWAGRVLALDLDTLIVGSLDPIVDYPAPFVCAGDSLAPSLESPPVCGTKGGKTWRPRVQGSVIAWDAGAVNALWTLWTPAIAAQFYTDQDWIGELYPDVPVLPVSWFPRVSQVQWPLPAEAKVLLVKKPKNVLAADRWPWFNALWRAA